jgi:hypothetical protein
VTSPFATPNARGGLSGGANTKQAILCGIDSAHFIVDNLSTMKWTQSMLKKQPNGIEILLNSRQYVCSTTWFSTTCRLSVTWYSTTWFSTSKRSAVSMVYFSCYLI